jgi:hypothetical protein
MPIYLLPNAYIQYEAIEELDDDSMPSGEKKEKF